MGSLDDDTTHEVAWDERKTSDRGIVIFREARKRNKGAI